MKPEILARMILILLLGAAMVVGVLGVGPALGLKLPFAPAEIELHAREPENGGWSQTTFYAVAGQPLRLRLTSDDVLHSFAIGQSSQPPIDLQPGEWTETTLVFDKPGRYTFYCTRWCGPNHWRMRGTIEVSEAAGGGGMDTPSNGVDIPAASAPKPLYLRLGLDLDAPHLAGEIPTAAPSVTGGAALAARLPGWALDRQTYLESSPAAAWERLRAEPTLKDLSDAQLWDVVAYLWSRQTSTERVIEAAQLYATNCAACHGESGKGDGVMVEGLPRYQPGLTHDSPTAGQAQSGMDGMNDPGNMRLSAPPDFSDPHVLLGASPALLEGKMLRGGMGTGMPYWGPIFTGDQMDAIIAYLYQFALKN